MGICWSCFAGKSNPSPSSVPPPATPPATPPVAYSIPEPDPLPSSIGHLIDGDTSFLGSHVSGTSWLSMLTTNFSVRLSQASGKIAAIWGNNPNDENDFSATIEDDNLPDVGTSSDSKLRGFTLAQLKAATCNFRNDKVLGRGGFGSVYKGWIRERSFQGIRKRPIAVKRLDANSKQGSRQWRTEVGFLGRLSHPNIVKLLGYCKENENFLIVYEFMQKGSLNYYLFSDSSNRLLSWETRVKVMIGMAQGLAYLHMMEKPIIYRDFKSSNILLDESYTAKISDFGLAKWGPTAGNSCVTGHVMGTVGYTAPEYVASGKLFVKSDVYSFGVVLVEMLTGSRAIDKRRPPAQQNLVDWVGPFLLSKSRLKGIMDSRLDGKYSAKEAEQIAQLALKCLNTRPKLRPSMKECAETLQHIGERYRIDEA